MRGLVLASLELLEETEVCGAPSLEELLEEFNALLLLALADAALRCTPCARAGPCVGGLSLHLSCRYRPLLCFFIWLHLLLRVCVPVRYEHTQKQY